MATFTVTTSQNIDALTGKTGGDIYNINGGTLTVDQDSRFGQNNSNASATAATSMGNITLSATLGGILDVDARFVRIIPYSSGTGNVPALGTTITQGGASGKLISVMSSLTALPTASGSAMPATGFIKIKAWNSVAFAVGALTGIGASASGADTVGWIEIVGDEASTCTVPRLGTARFRGEKYQLGTTNGVANQTFQIPTQGLAALYCPGVYIEKTVGSNDYEFYPNAGSQTTVATDIRAKVVWISTSGLVRVGHNGTANAGFLPVTGLKVVIPNIILQNCTTAARNANALPNATLATRYDFTTTGGGVIDMSHIYGAWYLSFAQAFSVTLSYVAVMEQISVSEIASPMTWNEVGVGQTAAQTQFALLMSLCFAGGAFTDCHWSRATLALSAQYTVSLTDIAGFTFVNDRQTGLTAKANATTGNTTATRCVNCIWISPKLTNGRMVFITCTNISVTGWSYVDRISGTTATTAVENSYVFELSANTNGFLQSGGDFMGITNVQPYLGILNIAAAGCANIKLRSIGTRASPLNLGSTNNSAYLFVLATGAAASDVKVQRCYVSNTRTGLWTGDNSSTRITLEKVFGDYADAPVSPMLNFLAKGVGCTHPLTAQTAVYGTHFIDYFTSTAVGRIGILMNEATSLTSSQVTLASGVNFTSAGGLYMPTIGMNATFEMPYFALGHTSFQNTAGVMAGGVIGNYTLEYQIDKNNGSGYNGTWKTLNGANLSGETGIDGSKGMKLKVRITTSTTNATAITSLYILTNSSTTAQDYEYPLDTIALQLSGLVSGSDIVILQAGTSTILEAIDANIGSTYNYVYSTLQNVDIGVLKSGHVPLYIRNYPLGSTNTSIPIAQVPDRNYI